MPYVNIRIAGTLSDEQRKQIAAEVTDTLERVYLNQNHLFIFLLMSYLARIGLSEGSCWERKSN